MPGLIIDREILIEAPVEVVWRTITEPDQISQWFADRVELVSSRAPTATWSSGTRAARSSWRPSIRRFASPSAGTTPAGRSRLAGNSMLVEFTLTPEGDERTRASRDGKRPRTARLARRGESSAMPTSTKSGWGEYLDRLATLAAKQPR